MMELAGTWISSRRAFISMSSKDCPQPRVEYSIIKGLSFGFYLLSLLSYQLLSAFVG